MLSVVQKLISHNQDGILVIKMEMVDLHQIFTMLQIFLVDLSLMMSIFLKQAVDATLLSILSKCLDLTQMVLQIHLKVEITIVMLTMLVVYGAQKWISWRPICMHGTQLLISVMLHKENISTTVIEEVVVNHSNK